MLKSAEQMFDIFVTTKLTEIQSKYPFCNPSICDWIWTMDDSVIESIDLNTLDSILDKIGIEKRELNRIRQDNARMRMSLLEFTKFMFRDVKNDLKEVLKQKHDLDDLKQQVMDAEQQVIDYTHSEEYLEAKKKRIENLEEAVEKEEDEKTKKELQEKLKIIKGLNYCEYLKDRVNTYGDKEISSLEKSFFSPNGGSLVMSKFKAACKKMGVNEEIYSRFFDLEETFLTEEYAPFNNFFLHICMRYVGYADLNNTIEKMYVDNLFNRLRMLILHSFESDDEEKQFIGVIKSVLDPFMKDVETFKEKNITYKSHPDRLAREEKTEKERKERFLDRLELMGIEITDEIRAMDSISLGNFYTEKMTKRNDIIINAMEDVLKEKEEKKKEDAKETENESEKVVESSEDIPSGIPLYYMGNEDEGNYEDVSDEEVQKQKEESGLSDEEWDNLMNDPHGHIWGDEGEEDDVEECGIYYPKVHTVVSDVTELSDEDPDIGPPRIIHGDIGPNLIYTDEDPFHNLKPSDDIQEKYLSQYLSRPVDESAKISEEEANESVIPKMKELENRATHCNFDSSKLSKKEESKDSNYNPLEVVDLEVDTILPDGFKIESVKEDSSDDE